MDICPQKLLLIEDYNRATNTYSEAVTLHLSQMQFVSKVGFIKRFGSDIKHSKDNARQACQLCAEARYRLKRHIAQHGCSVSCAAFFPKHFQNVSRRIRKALYPNELVPKCQHSK
jgi:hypothetical protein